MSKRLNYDRKLMRVNDPTRAVRPEYSETQRRKQGKKNGVVR